MPVYMIYDGMECWAGVLLLAGTYLHATIAVAHIIYTEESKPINSILSDILPWC